jgi:flagellar basal-body rod protein FlgB
MAISDIPLFGMLRTKMTWHQQRQRLLAENVANADTPNFRPRDLVQPEFGRSAAAPGGVTLQRTAAGHFGGSADGATSFRAKQGGYEVRPSGNAVHLEDEMLKVASNQMDYQAATTLYSRSLGLLKTAIRR